MITGLLSSVLVLTPAAISVRVEGEGYLRFLQDGRAVYARTASLAVEKGELRSISGPGFLPPIRVPNGSKPLIGADGTVTVATGTKVGRLYLARFASGATFEEKGAFLLARDRADLGYPGEEGLGRVVATSPGETLKNEERITKNERRAETSAIPILPVSANGQRLTANESLAANRQPPTANQFRITIPATVEIDGPKFTLGDIAKIEGPEAERLKAIDLGNAPVHGIPMLFARERVLARITVLGIDRKVVDLDMPPTVQIQRRGQTITSDQLLAAARTAVAEKTGLKGELDAADRLTPIAAPLGKLEIVAESTSVGGGTATVSLGIRIDGRRFTGRTIRLSGESLIPAVEPGAVVTVRFIASGLSVEMPGKAKTAGAIGQTIDVAVTIPETRETTIHQGTVVRPGVVEVRA